MNGRWRNIYQPLGEGIVKWDSFFEYLKEFGYTGPISLHVEYHMYDEKDPSVPVGKKRKIAKDQAALTKAGAAGVVMQKVKTYERRTTVRWYSQMR